MGHVTSALVLCSAQTIDHVAALYALAVRSLMAPVNSATSVKDLVYIKRIRTSSACFIPKWHFCIGFILLDCLFAAMVL